jgi:hypothetical protein
MVVFLAWIPAADPLIPASGMIVWWPWWTLCTTLLAVRWLYLLPHHQQEVVSVSTPVVWIIWGVLLAATVATGLLAVVWSGTPVDVIADVWRPLVFGILIGCSGWWLAVKNRLPAMPTVPPGDCWSLLERGFSRVHHWVMSAGFQLLPRWRAAVLTIVNRLLQSQTRVWQNALNAGERALRSWTLAVTLLLLTGIAIALLST